MPKEKKGRQAPDLTFYKATDERCELVKEGGGVQNMRKVKMI